VAAHAARPLLDALDTEIVCLDWPDPLGHVGMAYRRFDVPSETEILQILGR
jgi:predicted phosphoribosyltransferase